jgi:hypothetical protein
MTEHPADRFELVLKRKGWRTVASGHLTKGDWRIIFDTSTWMVLQTASNPRTFDVAVPDPYRSGWTVNLIEHLARIEDERTRLRAALVAIRDDPGAGPSAVSAASAALAKCYHTWLGEPTSPSVVCDHVGGWRVAPGRRGERAPRLGSAAAVGVRPPVPRTGWSTPQAGRPHCHRRA